MYRLLEMIRLAFLIFLSGCAVNVNQRQPTAAPESTGNTRPGAESMTDSTPASTFKLTGARSANPFAKIKSPLAGPAQAIGGYSAGCVIGAEPMPKSGPGFEMMRLKRHRFFGHPALNAVLMRAGKELGSESTLLYGDLAQARGGPMPGGHASHQSGLDADIWFYRFPSQKKITDRQRESLHASSVLAKNYVDLNPRQWHDIYAQQLMWFAGQAETERIFVNAAIKKRLCEQFPNDPRLARLRPWFFHDDHFHLRLKCPEGEVSCVPQKPADGIECDEKDLQGWFAPEVIAKFTTPSTPQPFDVDLPIECKTLIP